MRVQRAESLPTIRQRIDAKEFCPASGQELITAIRFEMLHAQENLTGTAASNIAALEQKVMQTDPIKAEALLQDSASCVTTCRRSARARRRSTRFTPRSSRHWGRNRARGPRGLDGPHSGTVAGVRSPEEHHRPGTRVSPGDGRPVPDPRLRG